MLALHHHQPSTTIIAACLRVHCPSLRRRFSPLQVPPLSMAPSEPIAAAEPWSSLCAHSTRALLATASAHCQYASTVDMVRTRGGYLFRPRVRFSTPEMEEPGTSAAAGDHLSDLHADTQPTLAPTAIPEEPQGFRRYHTRMGPRAPSLVPPSGPGHQAWGSP